MPEAVSQVIFPQVSRILPQIFADDSLSADDSDCGIRESIGVNLREIKFRFARRKHKGLLRQLRSTLGTRLCRKALPIQIAFVHDIEGACFKVKDIQHVHVVGQPVRDVDETGYLAADVQQCVQLYGRFVLSELRPPEHFQAEVDGRGVERIDTVVQFKAFQVHRLRVQQPGLPDEQLGEVGINLPVPPLVGVGKCALANALGQPQVVQLVFVGL